MLDQTYQMRRLFETNPNEWVPLYKIQKVAAQYNARIHELRTAEDHPMEIENRIQIVNGERHSWYRYCPPGQKELFGWEVFNQNSGAQLAGVC